MSSASDRMLKIMAYADGELEGAERAEVEAWLAEDAQAARLANELTNLGDLVQLGHEGSSDAKAVAAFDVADAVMSAVAKDAKPEAAAAAPVVSLDRARARRFRSGAIAAAALAIAASVLLLTRSKQDEPMALAPVPTVQPSANVAPDDGPGVDVELADTPGHSVSVFYLPSESSQTSVMVWVDETGGK
jgi:anti-sigma factor RsiW